MVDKKEVIEALRWGADEWDKKAINLAHAHACKLCDIFNDTCEGCPLLIKSFCGAKIEIENVKTIERT